MRIVVLGAPGAGKGTQARNLANYYNAPHISTGDMLREHMRNGTEIGNSIRDLMDHGELVPDELVIELVTPVIEDGNYILDGFPRTLAQAEQLTGMTERLRLPLHCVVSVNVPDEVIMERMTGRVTCPHCGAMFHLVYYPPKSEGLCDGCGTGLVQREDDKARTVQNRLRVYHEMTEPIISYYRAQGILIEVDGVGEMQDIAERLIAALEEGK